MVSVNAPQGILAAVRPRKSTRSSTCWSTDGCLIGAGWQYPQYPEVVAAELMRITRPCGQLIVAFSNRMFFIKAPQMWSDGSDRDHLTDGSEEIRALGLNGLVGGKGDPFFSVIAIKSQ